MDFKEKLKIIGLTGSETKIYLFLLENGVSTPPQIAKGTGIARTNCYHILKKLQVDGLIEEQEKNKRKVYLAQNPTAVIRALERKREMVEQMLPELRAVYKVQKNQPVIKFYDGLENILKIFDQTLEAKEILGIASTEKLFSLAGDYFFEYQKKIQQRGVQFRDILTHISSQSAGKKARSAMGDQYRYHVLDPKFGDVPTDVLIWDDNIALITLDEPIFGTVISSPTLASAFRMFFEIIWEQSNLPLN